MDLESMALEMVGHTLEEKEAYLLENNRVAHIPVDSKLSKVFSEQDKKRFENVGACFYFRKENDSELKYQRICKMVGEYLFEKNPVVFEFYDEFINGNVYEDSYMPTNSKSK